MHKADSKNRTFNIKSINRRKIAFELNSRKKWLVPAIHAEI